jgi:hypothetical protein
MFGLVGSPRHPKLLFVKAPGTHPQRCAVLFETCSVLAAAKPSTEQARKRRAEGMSEAETGPNRVVDPGA